MVNDSVGQNLAWARTSEHDLSLLYDVWGLS